MLTNFKASKNQEDRSAGGQSQGWVEQHGAQPNPPRTQERTTKDPFKDQASLRSTN